MKPCPLSLSRRGKRAFTLVELLVVLSVIIIISSAVFVSFNYTGGTRGLDKGLGVVHSMTRIARAQAILNGTSSRLIIHLNSAEPEKFLRYIGVIVKDDTDPDCGDCWRAVDRGVYLPEGVYVVPQPVEEDVEFVGNWADLTVEWDSGELEGGDAQFELVSRQSIYKIDRMSSNKGGAVFQVDYPMARSVAENSGTRWLGMQFGPSGRIEAFRWNVSGVGSNSNRLVLAFGERLASDLEFRNSVDLRVVGFKPNGSAFTISELDKL